MADNYKGEIDINGKFICFISRKELNYGEDCGLDFRATPSRVRWLISNEVTKEATLEAGKMIDNASDSDQFTCFISGITYNVKQELSLVFLSSSFLSEKILISVASCLKALEDNQGNQELRRQIYGNQ